MNLGCKLYTGMGTAFSSMPDQHDLRGLAGENSKANAGVSATSNSPSWASSGGRFSFRTLLLKNTSLLITKSGFDDTVGI